MSQETNTPDEPRFLCGVVEGECLRLPASNFQRMWMEYNKLEPNSENERQGCHRCHGAILTRIASESFAVYELILANSLS